MYEVSSWDTSIKLLETDNVVARITKYDDEGIVETLDAKYCCRFINGKFRHTIYPVRLVHMRTGEKYPEVDELMLGLLIDEVISLLDRPIFNFKFLDKEDTFLSVCEFKGVSGSREQRIAIPIMEEAHV